MAVLDKEPPIPPRRFVAVILYWFCSLGFWSMSEKSLSPINEELSNRKLLWVICETAAYLLVILVAIVGNSLILLAVYRNSQLRTVPNYLIVTLALSDIFLLFLCGPQSVSVAIVGYWPFNDYVCQAQGYFVAFFACASLQIVSLTAINRFYKIVRTKSYKRIFTKQKTVIMIGICFLLASLQPLPYFLSGRRYLFHPGKMFCFQTTEISIPNFLGYVYLGVPATTLAVCYFLVFKEIRKHQHNVRRNLQSSSTNENITSRDIKITKILFVTVVGFLACWTPIAVIDFMDTFRGKVSFPRQVYFFYLVSANLSAFINPIVYGLLNKNFREEYKKMIFFRKRNNRVVILAQNKRKTKPFVTSLA